MPKQCSAQFHEKVSAPSLETANSGGGTYAGDMKGLSKNDIDNALDDMADGTIASGVVYSDIEGERQNPELKLVMAVDKSHLMQMLNRQWTGHNMGW